MASRFTQLTPGLYLNFFEEKLFIVSDFPISWLLRLLLLLLTSSATASQTAASSSNVATVSFVVVLVVVCWFLFSQCLVIQSPETKRRDLWYTRFGGKEKASKGDSQALQATARSSGRVLQGLER